MIGRRSYSFDQLSAVSLNRGCRMTVTYPEIAAMQTKAIIKAALAVKRRHPESSKKLFLPNIARIPFAANAMQ